MTIPLLVVHKWRCCLRGQEFCDNSTDKVLLVQNLKYGFLINLRQSKVTISILYDIFNFTIINFEQDEQKFWTNKYCKNFWFWTKKYKIFGRFWTTSMNIMDHLGRLVHYSVELFWGDGGEGRCVCVCRSHS